MSRVSNGGVDSARAKFFDTLDGWSQWRTINKYTYELKKAISQGTSQPLPPQSLAHPPKITVVSRARSFGPTVSVNADTLVRAKAASLDVRTITGSKAQFAESSSVTTLCVPNGDDSDYLAVGLVSISSQKPVASDEYQDTNANCLPRGSSLKATAQKTRYQAHVRTVEGLFYYLGYIQKKPDPILEFLLPTAPPNTYRISVHYRDQTYYVQNDEMTMSILAILNNLVNINRTADELPKTTAVQQVGGG